DGEVLLEPEAQTVRGRAPGWGGTGPLAHGSTGLVARAATVLFARAVADLLAPPSAGRLARPHAGLLAPPSAGRLARRHPLATECALLLARLLLGLRIVLEAVDDHPEGGVQQTVPDVGDVMVLADAAAIGDVGRESGRSRLAERDRGLVGPVVARVICCRRHTDHCSRSAPPLASTGGR